MRKIELAENKKLTDLFKKNLEMAKEGKRIYDEVEKIKREQNKFALQKKKLQDKITPIIEREINPQLAETEEIAVVKLVGDKVVAEIVDRVEEFKTAYINRKKDKSGAESVSEK